jgi:integrase
VSVYKRGETYYYDFWLAGQRFHGRTECASKREAQRIEKQIRDAERAKVKQRIKPGRAPLTLREAGRRYFEEVGQFLKGGGDENLLWSLAWLDRHAGEKTLIEINDAEVARLVALRRGEGVRNATVNRSMTEQLRKVMNRAAAVWSEPVGRVEWKRHQLKEPRERVRELRTDEEIRFFEILREDYHPVLRFAILTGVRLGEVLIRWRDIDWGARQITVHGKGGKIAPIPMPPALRDMLWALQGHHEEFVFTYEAKRTRSGRVSGHRYPITREGLKTAFRRAIPNAGIENYRFHDNRHTAATRVLRAGGNLKVVQNLLRHDNIATTAKYAHAVHDDIMSAMQAAAEHALAATTASPTKSPTDDVDTKLKSLQRKGLSE